MGKYVWERERRAKIRSTVIQEKTFDIWAMVRENRNSLDADRICNMISALIEESAADIEAIITPIIREHERLKVKLAEKTQELRKSKESARQLRNELELIREQDATGGISACPVCGDMLGNMVGNSAQ